MAGEEGRGEKRERETSPGEVKEIRISERAAGLKNEDRR